MALSPRETYQLTYNQNWIKSLEHKEIASYSVDHLENQWMLYKDKYSTTSSDENRLLTQKNRPGDVLLRYKNKPYGFKLTSDTYNIEDTGRRYQASIIDDDLRKVLNGNCYELKMYDFYGIAFGKSDDVWMSILFEITGTAENTLGESFVNITVLHKNIVSSLYAFVDNEIYNDHFYTITYAYDESHILTVHKYNISTQQISVNNTHTLNTDTVSSTSVEELTGDYPPISSRLIPISGVSTDKLGRIWSVEYSNELIHLAYECAVPLERSVITSVTEGIVLIEIDKHIFLDSSSGTLTLYVFDTIEDTTKYSEAVLCQAFIPEFDDVKKSFGESISVLDDTLAVGSDIEEAVYIFDLNTINTPDIFSTDFPSLPTNGVKIPKDYTYDRTPVFPIRMNTGIMDFEIFGGSGIKWIKPDGTVETDARPSITLENNGVIYLVMDSFIDNVKIDAHSTTGYVGLLNDVPNVSFGLDFSNTTVSGYFNTGSELTDININSTNLTQTDLEQCAIVLHESGNLNGTFIAYTDMPTITSLPAQGAINSLIAKGWTITINMNFADIDPMMSINGEIIQGALNTIYSIDDMFNLNAAIIDGSIASGTI